MLQTRVSEHFIDYFEQMVSQGTRTNDLPLGVKLLHTIKDIGGQVHRLAFDPSGRILASGSYAGAVKLWETISGRLLHEFEWEDHRSSRNRVDALAFSSDGRTIAIAGMLRPVGLWNTTTGKFIKALEPGALGGTLSVAFNQRGDLLASGRKDGTIRLWDTTSSKLLLDTYEGHYLPSICCVAFDPLGETLYGGSEDGVIRLWEVGSGRQPRILEGHNSAVLSLAFDFHRLTLASSSADKTIKLWDVATGKLTKTLEGHSAPIDIVAFSADSMLLASKSRDGAIRIWDCSTWEPAAVLSEPVDSSNSSPAALTFHSALPMLATNTSEIAPARSDRIPCIRLLELNSHALLFQQAEVSATARVVHHTTGKIVLLGDHGVGKSALGYRLIHGRFEKQESTHGQQFWVFPALGRRRADGTDCEAILWDFAGQPDYRLVHALFVDNADLALVLFDASDLRDPLHGVDFWLKQLHAGHSHCPIILVAAQTDRGTCSLTWEELEAFCHRNCIAGPIATSAATGLGVAELFDHMKSLIPWEDKPATVTTTTFKCIKDYVLGLKEGERSGRAIVTPAELRGSLQAIETGWHFTDDEMLTAVGHLENYGYVKCLRTSNGEQRILLQPERLNNLASSFVLEARRNPRGLGALEEKRLLADGYDFPELKGLDKDERDVLLDSAALLFLEHNVCFRETDPLSMEQYLVFPELINLKKPPEPEAAYEDGAAYTVSGKTENVFASLVVLLGYTHTFTRTAQWQNNARYEVGAGLMCGFRQEAERDGELDFVFCFGANVGLPVQKLFQGLFESFLARRNLTVMRYETVRCSNLCCLRLLDRAVVRRRLKEGKTFAFCDECGEKLTLSPMTEAIQLTREVRAEVASQTGAAAHRTRFEQAIFRLHTYMAEQEITPPECFISYAWGVPEHERWVEKRLVPDLQKAGLRIVFDRKDNHFGDSLTRFINRIPYCASVVVVGTPLYFQKFENRLSGTGSVVAAEVDLISQRLIGSEEEKRAVKTVLLAGDKKTSLPPLMWDRLHADFRDEMLYFTVAFDLILSLYQLPSSHPAVTDLREPLRTDMR